MNASCQMLSPLYTPEIYNQVIVVPIEKPPLILISEKEYLELKSEVGYWRAMPPKVIPKSPYGISIWEAVLLNKFHYCQPTNRLVNQYTELGLPISLGTITGGLKNLKELLQPVYNALPGFVAAVWQTAPRDQFIGWNHNQRKKNLNLIVNNARFLILPWIQSKNLASKILSLTARHLPDDWVEKYNIRPVLMETFVQKNRFAGTCYKAANWINVGQTKGRGKLGPPGKISVPIKDVWVYPIDRKFKALLKN